MDKVITTLKTKTNYEDVLYDGLVLHGERKDLRQKKQDGKDSYKLDITLTKGPIAHSKDNLTLIELDYYFYPSKEKPNLPGSDKKLLRSEHHLKATYDASKQVFNVYEYDRYNTDSPSRREGKTHHNQCKMTCTPDELKKKLEPYILDKEASIANPVDQFANPQKYAQDAKTTVNKVINNFIDEAAINQSARNKSKDVSELDDVIKKLTTPNFSSPNSVNNSTPTKPSKNR